MITHLRNATSIALLTTLLLSNCVTTPTAADNAPIPPARRNTDIEHRIFIDANQERARAGKRRLRRNPQLNEAAHLQASYMAHTGKFQHRSGKYSIIERASQMGYAGGHPRLVGENIAYLPPSLGDTPQTLGTRIVTMWRDSKSHRSTLLDDGFVDTGVAAVKSTKDGRTYAVQVFGAPRG